MKNVREFVMLSEVAKKEKGVSSLLLLMGNVGGESRSLGSDADYILQFCLTLDCI